MGMDWESILDCVGSANVRDAYEDIVYKAGVMLGDFEEYSTPGAYPLDLELLDECDRLRFCYPDEESVNDEFYLARLELCKDENGRPYQMVYLADQFTGDTLAGIIRDSDHFLTEAHQSFLINFIGVIEYRSNMPVLMISEHGAPSAEEIREHIATYPAEDLLTQPDNTCEESSSKTQNGLVEDLAETTPGEHHRGILCMEVEKNLSPDEILPF